MLYSFDRSHNPKYKILQEFFVIFIYCKMNSLKNFYFLFIFIETLICIKTEILTFDFKN